MGRHVGKAASAVQPWLVAGLLIGLGAYAIGTSGGVGAPSAKLAPPPGSIGGTMKTLDEIEPRTPLNRRFVSSGSGAMFVITSPGSYYLPSDLAVGAGEVGVRIEASPVVLDLMGNAIDGAHGSSDLIMIGSLGDRVVVRNGTLRRSAAHGLRSLADTLVVQDLEVAQTRQAGLLIDSGRAVTLRDVSVTDAGTGSSGDRSGISLSGPSVVRARDLDVTFTGMDGIRAGSSTRLSLEDAFVGDAGDDGIEVSGKAVLRNVRVERSGDDGIRLGDKSVAEECQVDSIRGYGIVAGSHSRVERCRVYAYSNEVPVLQSGIIVEGSNAVVRGNVVIGGGSGYYGVRVSGALNTVAGNAVYENSAFSISSNNLVGPILTSTMSWNTNDDPNANLSID